MNGMTGIKFAVSLLLPPSHSSLTYLLTKADDVKPRNRRDPYIIVLDVMSRLAKYKKAVCLSLVCIKINKILSDLKILNTRYFKSKFYDWLYTISFYSVKKGFLTIKQLY